jgi:hypothetical protein
MTGRIDLARYDSPSFLFRKHRRKLPGGFLGGSVPAKASS